MATSIVAPTDATSSDEGISVSKRNYLLSNREREYDPNGSIALHALKELGDLASTWWSIFEMLREVNDHGAESKGCLPAWVAERIGDWRQQHEAHDVMRRLLDDAQRAVAISEGQQRAVYEIWTKRGHRLDGRYEYWTQAEAALKAVAGRFPDAYVSRVHYHAPKYNELGPELLDTLIGRIFWSAVSFGQGDEEDTHTVQDETGRTVCVPASALRAHPCFRRMSKDGQSRIECENRRRNHKEAHHG